MNITADGARFNGARKIVRNYFHGVRIRPQNHRLSRMSGNWVASESGRKLGTLFSALVEVAIECFDLDGNETIGELVKFIN